MYIEDSVHALSGSSNHRSFRGPCQIMYIEDSVHALFHSILINIPCCKFPSANISFWFISDSDSDSDT